MKRSLFLAGPLLAMGLTSPAVQDPVVYIRTELAVIVVKIDQGRAPPTAANSVKIEIIQL